MAVTASQGRFRTMAWCGHCRRTSNAEWDGLCISCLACGKVLGDFTVWQTPSFMARGLTKKIRKRTRRASTVASAQASMNELPQMSFCKTEVIRKGSTSTDVSAETSTK